MDLGRALQVLLDRFEKADNDPKQAPSDLFAYRIVTGIESDDIWEFQQAIKKSKLPAGVKESLAEDATNEDDRLLAQYVTMPELYASDFNVWAELRFNAMNDCDVEEALALKISPATAQVILDLAKA